MRFLLELFKEVAFEVRYAVQSLVGSEEAAEVLQMGADGTPTKNIDDVAEKAAIKALKSSEIPMVVLSEERGRVILGEEPEYICVIDPLDGTLNATKGLPIFSTSIALAPYGDARTIEDLEFGLVMDLANGDIFEAKRGGGAEMNGKRIRTSQTEKLEEAALSIYAKPGRLESVESLIKKSRRIRCLGSVALELCYVAMGGYEAMVDLRRVLKVTDIAAGKLIIEEAGGVVSDREGKILNYDIQSLDRVEIIASGNKKIHSSILSLVRP
ncbi:MAG: bifunctional fructose-bisphosphatase/inositol-phosphate phosphatase [Candidatus Hydrothermarchaeales archaeon]